MARRNRPTSLQVSVPVLLAILGLLLVAGMARPAVALRSQAPLPGRSGGNASAVPLSCQDVVQPSGAIHRTCMPDGEWNGELIVYAHGYVAPNRPVQIPEEQLYLPDGNYLPDVVNSLGYAFAMSSYPTNGLAVRQGLTDLVDLVGIFRTAHPTVTRIYLAGASEGGLITTLGIEQYPDMFSGGLATCGPVGDFRAHIDYVGDFRVVFDYFFPDLITGTAITIPPGLMDTWDNYFTTTVLPAISDPASAFSVTQLLSVTQAAYDPTSPTTAISTISGILWYSIFGTADASAKLGGQPFDNHDRVYGGSADDAALNAGVQRFTADQAALAEIEAYYQTAGRPGVALVTTHTTLDPIVPYWHETLYRSKVLAHGRALWHDDLPVVRYGHCRFTETEVLVALLVLEYRVLHPPRQVFLPLILRNSASAWP